jgi:hypothetical protein
MHICVGWLGDEKGIRFIHIDTARVSLPVGISRTSPSSQALPFSSAADFELPNRSFVNSACEFFNGLFPLSLVSCVYWSIGPVTGLLALKP